MGIIKDPTSWRTGFELGLAGFSFPYSKPRKPTAYLYNGIRLPALPEWDRGVYPYACITDVRSTESYRLHISANPYTKSKSIAAFGADVLKQKDATLYIVGYSENRWELISENNSNDTYLESTPLVWTNTDIMNTADSTVYFAASDPVPVYE